MTGAQFWSYLQQKIDKAYSAYLDNAKANALIKESMYRSIERMYHQISFEKEEDELVSVIVKDKVVTPAAGICTLNVGATTPSPPANEIPYYMHMMRVLANYETDIAVTASGTTLTTPNHILRKGSVVKYSSTLYTVTYINGDTFQAVDSSGNYATASGTYKMVFSREMKQMSSTRKSGSFHKANIVTPRFEFFNNGTSQNRSLKLTPAPVTISVDYIRIPPVDVDVADTTIKLTDYYPTKFLYYIMDECVKDFGGQTKDPLTRQIASQDIIENP